MKESSILPWSVTSSVHLVLASWPGKQRVCSSEQGHGKEGQGEWRVFQNKLLGP